MLLFLAQGSLKVLVFVSVYTFLQVVNIYQIL